MRSGHKDPPRLRGGGPPKVVEGVGGLKPAAHEDANPLRQRFALPPPRKRGGIKRPLPTPTPTVGDGG